MIACKEDLIGKYVETQNEELLDLFYDACERFGINWLGGNRPRDFTPYLSRIGVERDLTIRQGFADGQYKPLTLSDLKPRTKVEYVKVTDSIWHLESDFKAGDLFAFDGQDNYVQIEAEGDFTLSHSADNLYRCIETPMTEREAFIDECQKYGSWEEMFDSGKFKLVN